MSILKYKDPKTGEFKRINPYKADSSFVGKDGIVVNKDPNSEEVEISGSGCVQKDTRPARVIYAHSPDGSPLMLYPQTMDDLNEWWLPVYRPSVSGDTVRGNAVLLTAIPTRDYQCANKKYVDDNYVEKVKFTNLEQALNGYILDTTKEAYADLDSAVLKDSVAVGDNVYPIADKTRALVTRIEGKTTKMVQLFDKSVIPATKTVNGITFINNNDGSITINGTATAEVYIIIVARDKVTNGNKVLYGSEQNTSNYGVAWGTNLNPSKFNNTSTQNNFTIKVNSGVTVDNVKIYPQLFDLTAMNREDITTVEQFKAEFPDIYPYENGNIYPAKISGVKFTGKNLLKLKLSSTNKCNVNIEDDVLKITPTASNAEDIVFAEVKTHLKAGEYVLSSISENQNTTPTKFIVSKGQYGENNITTIFSETKKFVLDNDSDIFILIYPCLHSELPFKAMSVQMQIQAGSQATAYEPYIEPVSVTLSETYDLHGIGDYRDYLEITKNEDNELYTLKKVQSVEVNESEKTITSLATPVETVIATNLTYEQVTAIRHNGGLIEVEGNTNKAYAKPTIKNTVVYRLTATNTAEV